MNASSFSSKNLKVTVMIRSCIALLLLFELKVHAQKTHTQEVILSKSLPSSLSQLLIGKWQSGALSFDLKANRELKLKQDISIVKLNESKLDTRSQLAKDENESGTYLGYWWFTDQHLCFLLDLSSQCMSYRIQPQIHTAVTAQVLKVKLGQQWVIFNKIAVKN